MTATIHILHPHGSNDNDTLGGNAEIVQQEAEHACKPLGDMAGELANNLERLKLHALSAFINGHVSIFGHKETVKHLYAEAKRVCDMEGS